MGEIWVREEYVSSPVLLNVTVANRILSGESGMRCERISWGWRTTPQILPGGEARKQRQQTGPDSGGGLEFRSGVALGLRRAGEVLAAVTLERLVRRLG
jgi:hypothetical protein